MNALHPALTNGTYDVARVREDFPILATKVYGKPLIYLDNAASSQKPKAVLDRIQRAYTCEYANVHRGLHYLANAATEAYEGAMAAAMGGNVRVGLEDSLWIGPGKLAESNAQQVRMARQIIEGLGLEIASPDEARNILSLKGGDKVAF